ncbi:uncharacterized protein H6S33_004171 [Morchella sextelata]|uniref:uncharacterized protein n=1 Tax=Morchella sextelata TaxID=1174677 RepID=UPI001D044202|nr:uncharacterized protein H6S33_004171 [Morchella sextelata]KAH0605714.1 hypothetical protein H6S33_004171 [Morchella sextelata]
MTNITPQPLMSYWDYEDGNETITADSFDSDSAYDDGGDRPVEDLTLLSHERANVCKYENGRRYHRYHEGQYAFPNDNQELDRMDLQHHISNLVFGGKLHFSPITTGEGDPSPILDIGFGSGIWAASMAEMYPHSQVIGVDLSWTEPIWCPPNCRLEVDDCEHDWLYKKDYFELVHIRYLNGSIRDWDRLFQQAYRHTRPGGWIELQECDIELYCDDNTLPPDSMLLEWFVLINKAATASERPFIKTQHFKSWLERAGYVNVKDKLFKVPINRWPKDKKMKELGHYEIMNIAEGLEGWSMALFTRVLGWEKDDVLVYLEKIKKEFRNRKVHAYWSLRATYGQKPMDSST